MRVHRTILLFDTKKEPLIDLPIHSAQLIATFSPWPQSTYIPFNHSHLLQLIYFSLATINPFILVRCVLKIGDRGEDDVGNSSDIINVDIADDSGEYPKI